MIRRPSHRQLVVAGGYAAAGALYVLIGVTYVDFLFTFVVALAYLLVVVWLVPAGVRRFL